ncbi:MAG: transporter associated domain-containing protein [Tepidisphaeraceae bacterium]
MNHIANAVTRPLGLGRVDEMDDEPVTVEELRLLAQRATENGTLTRRGQSLVLNSLSLIERTARDVMIHRSRVAYVDLKKSMDENRQVMNAHLYSRLPLCDGGFDRVIGVVYTKEFLTAFAEQTDSSVLQLIAKAPVFVPEQVNVDRLVSTFREYNTQLLLVTDEHGSVQGIVTLDDVLDELLEDTQPAATNPLTAGKPISVPGDTPARDIRSRYGLPEWADDSTATTLAGVLIAHAGRVPGTGEVIEADGLRFRIEESDPRRIGEVALLGPVETATAEASA